MFSACHLHQTFCPQKKYAEFKKFTPHCQRSCDISFSPKALIKQMSATSLKPSTKPFWASRWSQNTRIFENKFIDLDAPPIFPDAIADLWIWKSQTCRDETITRALGVRNQGNTNIAKIYPVMHRMTPYCASVLIEIALSTCSPTSSLPIQWSMATNLRTNIQKGRTNRAALLQTNEASRSPMQSLILHIQQRWIDRAIPVYASKLILGYVGVSATYSQQ